MRSAEEIKTGLRREGLGATFFTDAMLALNAVKLIEQQAEEISLLKDKIARLTDHGR